MPEPSPNEAGSTEILVFWTFARPFLQCVLAGDADQLQLCLKDGCGCVRRIPVGDVLDAWRIAIRWRFEFDARRAGHAVPAATANAFSSSS